jgi:hypothetical protein
VSRGHRAKYTFCPAPRSLENNNRGAPSSPLNSLAQMEARAARHEVTNCFLRTAAPITTTSRDQSFSCCSRLHPHESPGSSPETAETKNKSPWRPRRSRHPPPPEQEPRRRRPTVTLAPTSPCRLRYRLPEIIRILSVSLFFVLVI